MMNLIRYLPPLWMNSPYMEKKKMNNLRSPEGTNCLLYKQCSYLNKHLLMLLGVCFIDEVER